MADIGEEIKDDLLADTAVSNLVGTRIRSDTLPQGESMPSIVYRVISTTAHRGLNEKSDAASTRLQVDAYSDKRPEANDLAEKIRLRLDGQSGTYGTIKVREISVDGGVQYDYDTAIGGTAQHRYVSTQDFFIFHSIPTS